MKGEAIIGTAITEPDSGSDVTMTSTTAVKDGAELFACDYLTKTIKVSKIAKDSIYRRSRILKVNFLKVNQ